MKGGKYTKTLAKIWVEGTYPRKCFTQIYRALRETSVTEFCYKSVNLLPEELINIKVIILFPIHELFR